MADITLVRSILVPWILSGVSVGFLIFAAQYNRRMGYKKVRRADSPLEEAFLWITGVRASLSAESSLSDNNVLQLAGPLSGAVDSASCTTQQLLSLHSAIESDTSLHRAPVVDPAAVLAGEE
jgi:hypothetical protein